MMRAFSRSMVDVQTDCRAWAYEIARDYRPDVVVFLAKSGFLFAEPIAKELDVPLVEVLATRPGNGTKDAVRKFVPWVPRWLLLFVLGSRTMARFNDKRSERHASLGKVPESLDWDTVMRVLIVDDSVDTGWSILATIGLLHEVVPNAEVKVASYCVCDVSKDRIDVDWHRYTNTIVLTATSRYSSEHDAFLMLYQRWREGDADV